MNEETKIYEVVYTMEVLHKANIKAKSAFEAQDIFETVCSNHSPDAFFIEDTGLEFLSITEADANNLADWPKFSKEDL